MGSPAVQAKGNLAMFRWAATDVLPSIPVPTLVLTGTRWCAFLGLLWAFHIAGDRVLGYGLKFASGFQDTHLGRIGKQT